MLVSRVGIRNKMLALKADDIWVDGVSVIWKEVVNYFSNHFR